MKVDKSQYTETEKILGIKDALFHKVFCATFSMADNHTKIIIPRKSSWQYLNRNSKVMTSTDVLAQ